MAGLTKRGIDAARRSATRDLRLWDDDPRGFGVRIKPSGVATFFVQYTSPVTGRRVRHTIAQYGRLTLEEARIEARKLLGVVAKGEDPARERRMQRAEAKLKARTVAELCDRYMADAEAGLVTYRGRPKKASTLEIDRGRIARHIKPILGERLAQDVLSADIEAFFHAVRRGETAVTVKTGGRGVARVTGGPVTASRTVICSGPSSLTLFGASSGRTIPLRASSGRRAVAATARFRRTSTARSAGRSTTSRLRAATPWSLPRFARWL